MKTSLLLSFVSLLAITALGDEKPALAVIPAPQILELKAGRFKLTGTTKIFADAVAQQEGRWLANALKSATGFNLEVLTNSGSAPKKDSILLTTQDAKSSLGEEGYELVVSPDSVVIRAPHSAGLFYGTQTFLQLNKPEIFATKPAAADTEWLVPCVRVEDQPRFKWRGLMLDVSRHFFSKEQVKQLLDAMAMQKLNVFHWHLVDDQGWRIEIKKYPLLTKVGAWRKDIGFKLDPRSSTAYGPDGRYGGFYTQDDIREIVAYAQARHISIVPEIEMPGHSTAALAAYPELSCSGQMTNTDIGAGIHNGIYCAANPQAYEFLQDVLTEVFDLFPGKYIHIGGDEVKKNNWKNCEKCQALIKKEGLRDEKELQSYFIRRIESFVNSKHRNLIGWSEIREGGLAQNAAVMDWIGGGMEAASAGHDVVMTPKNFCYLDYYQSTNRAAEPRAIGGFLPLSKVYSLDPIPENLTPQFQSHIVGVQGNLWTEYVGSYSHLQYMTFPRLCALAEVGWSPRASLNYADFARRLQIHCKRLDQLGINYRHESVNEK